MNLFNECSMTFRECFFPDSSGRAFMSKAQGDETYEKPIRCFIGAVACLIPVVGLMGTYSHLKQRQYKKAVGTLLETTITSAVAYGLYWLSLKANRDSFYKAHKDFPCELYRAGCTDRSLDHFTHPGFFDMLCNDMGRNC